MILKNSGESFICIESAKTSVPPGSRILINSFKTFSRTVLGNSWNKYTQDTPWKLLSSKGNSSAFPFISSIKSPSKLEICLLASLR